MKKRKKGTTITQKIINDLKELIEAGFSVTASSKKVGIAASTASYISRGGFTMEGYRAKMAQDNSRRKRRALSKKEKTALFRDEGLVTPKTCRAVKIAVVIDGLTGAEASKKLGLGESTIYNIKGANYDFKTYRERVRAYNKKYEEKKAARTTPTSLELKKELEDITVVMKKINIRLLRFKEDNAKQLKRIETSLNKGRVSRETPIKEKKTKKEGAIGRILGKYRAD